MIEGASGILTAHESFDRPLWVPSRRRLKWRSGVVAQAFSSEDPEALRGPQFAAAWCRVRAPAPRTLRQPHPAILLRGDPPRGRPQPYDPRRLPHPRRDRVRLSRRGDRAGRRPRRDAAENRHQLERRATSSPPSTRCNRCVRTSTQSPSSRAGSATICAPAPARSRRGSTSSRRRPTAPPGASPA